MSVYLDKVKGWRYDFILEGKRYSAAGFETKVKARQAEAKRREEVENFQEIQDENTPIAMTFLELANRRLDHVQAYNSERHYMELKYMAKRWVKVFGKFEVTKVTSLMIQKFILQRAKVSGHVANKEIRYLKAIFNFAKKWKWIVDNPVEGIPLVPVEKRLKYVPKPEDIDKIIALADPDTQDYLWVIRETMARVSEVNRLTWDDVDLEGRAVVLYTRKKKGGHLTPRKVPMTRKLFEVFSRRYLNRDSAKPWVFWHTYTSSKSGQTESGPYKDRKKFMRTPCQPPVNSESISNSLPVWGNTKPQLFAFAP